MSELPFWVTSCLHEIACYELINVGAPCPLGKQLAAAELLSKFLAECRPCEGTGYLGVETTGLLGLPREEQGQCKRCGGSGRICRNRGARSVAIRPWPYMYVKPNYSEPSYEFRDPPALGKRGLRVRRALDQIPSNLRCVLLEYHASIDDQSPDPISSIIPLTVRGRAKTRASGRAAAQASLDLISDARALLDAARINLSEALGL